MYDFKYEKIDHPKWRYRLTENYNYFVREILPEVKHEYYNITKLTNNMCCVTVKKGYAWDGVTSPKWAKGLLDAKQFRKASLLHDVLLQAIYDDKLISKKYLSLSHKLFREEIENKFYAYSLWTGLVLFHKLWNKRNS